VPVSVEHSSEHSDGSIAGGEEALPAAAKLPSGWLSRWPWVTFILPMAIYMALGTCEPAPPQSAVSRQQNRDETGGDNPGNDDGENYDGGNTEEVLSDAEGLEEVGAESGSWWPLPYRFYPHVYTAKIVLTLLAILLVWPGYRTFPFRLSWLSVVVGVVGVVLWVGICHLNLEIKIIGPVDRFLGRLIPGLEEGETPSVGLVSLLGLGQRSAFNPIAQLAGTPGWAYAFLAIRFVGLALLVPVLEEFFLRGFVMRYVIHPQWWQVPFGSVNSTAVIIGTLVPMMMHPGVELFAAMIWFSMVTWLMVHTRNIWDCVVAHAVTNLLLGIYVVTCDQWQLM